MPRLSLITVLVLTVFTVAGCNQKQNDTVTQISTIDALLAGVYEGHITCNKLLHYGDTAIGTFDRLDGEMIIQDSIIYQIKADGKVYIPDQDLTVPFASIIKFRPDYVITISNRADFDEFKQIVSENSQNLNGFYAIKAHGRFSYIKTRSVPAQEKPYPPLVEVAKTQSVFEMENISGTVIGFYCPPYVKGINVTGYHLHFLSDDIKRGGHILDFTMQQGKVEIDHATRFTMILPKNSRPFQSLDLTTDRTKELENVEK